MNYFILPLLSAAAVACAAWGLGNWILTLTDPQRRKLKTRLAQMGHMGQVHSANLPRSIVIQMEAIGLSAVLVRFAPFRRLYTRLVQAWPELSLAKFLAYDLGLGLLLAMVLGGVMNSWPMAGAAMAFGMWVPLQLLSGRRAKRKRQIENQLPEALDFLSRILKAGHGLTTGLQMMGTELAEPIASEFRRCYDQHSLGHPLENALRGMVDRVESTDFAFFVTAVLIQRQTGGDLSEVLGNISNMIRGRIRLQSHVKAKTAEGRLTGYVLVAFPALMFLVSYALSPQQAGILLHTSTGLTLLGVAVGLQMLGLIAIRKITTVTV